MCEVVNLFMTSLLGVASYVDIKKKMISVYLLAGITLTAVAALFLLEKETGDVLFGAGIGIIFFFISKCTGEQIGYGDSWLVLALGIYAGGKLLTEILFAATFGAGLFSLIFCMLHTWNRKYAIPFIPFLTAAFIGVVLL